MAVSATAEKRLLPLKKFVRTLLWPLMPSWVDEGRRIVQGPVLRRLVTMAARERQFRRVLNAGSGEGGFSFMLAGLPGVKQLIETDINAAGARARVSSTQVFFASSLTDIPLAGHSVDFILCSEVLEHIRDDGKALDELARVLAPEGWLLISVPTPPAVHDDAHVREGYRPEDLHLMLEQRGFEVMDSRFCMHYFFRWVLMNWEKVPYRPRAVVRALSYLDRFVPIGPPMDLIVLARSKSGAVSHAILGVQ
jgi:SAM-dependent methyltransferase